MSNTHDKRFPGEDNAYREARTELLAEEQVLRGQIEKVANLRRSLPQGGKLQEDYVFEEGAADLSDKETVRQTRFSQLFREGKNSLIVYSFMYGPDWNDPCPMCTSLLDSFNGSAPHVEDRVNLAVVAKAPIQGIRAWAAQRGWDKLRLLSSGNNGYNVDYFAENAAGEQLPDINVFQKTEQGIFHFYNAELFFVAPEEGQHPRHVDMLWPLWNLFDLTPEGRGENWFPKTSYS